MGSFSIYKQQKRICILCYAYVMESAILHNIRCLSFSVVYKCRRTPSYDPKHMWRHCQASLTGSIWTWCIFLGLFPLSHAKCQIPDTTYSVTVSYRLKNTYNKNNHKKRTWKCGNGDVDAVQPIHASRVLLRIVGVRFQELLARFTSKAWCTGAVEGGTTTPARSFIMTRVAAAHLKKQVKEIFFYRSVLRTLIHTRICPIK